MVEDHPSQMGHEVLVRPSWQALVLFLAVLIACARVEGPEPVARRFMEHYYVLADLAGAKAFATGLAAQKIAEELHLIEGLTSDAQTRNRDVSYTLVEKKEEGGRAFLVYEVVITPKGGGGSFKKRSLLSLGQVEGAWRITNFRDFDV